MFQDLSSWKNFTIFKLNYTIDQEPLSDTFLFTIHQEKDLFEVFCSNLILEKSNQKVFLEFSQFHSCLLRKFSVYGNAQ